MDYYMQMKPYFRLFFTLMIRRNQVTYYSAHTRWWKNSQF